MKITESHKQSVLDTCVKLTLDGKKPSTALVRSKLSKGLPLALIIEGLNYFNANKDSLISTYKQKLAQLNSQQEKKEVSSPTTGNNTSGSQSTLPYQTCNDCLCATCSQAVRALSDELTQLKKELTALQSVVQALNPQ